MENASSREEVVAAIEALTREQHLRLERFARWRMRGLGRAAQGRDWEDLVGEAIAATYEGRRRWSKGSVDFFQHLIGVIRSISSHWRDQFNPDEAFFESEVIRVTPQGKTANPMVEVASPAADPEHAHAGKEEVKRIAQIASNNPLAWLILDGLSDGMTGPEIREALDVSQREYETAMKWLRRNIRRASEE